MVSIIVEEGLNLSYVLRIVPILIEWRIKEQQLIIEELLELKVKKLK